MKQFRVCHPVISLFIIFLLSGCGGTLKAPYYGEEALVWMDKNPTPDKKLVHTLFLVGDAGELDVENTEENFVLNAVKTQLASANKASSLVYLGDNIYPRGMPKKDDPTRSISEKKINAQLKIVEDFKGDTYFIPGNHDWNKAHKGGRKAIKRQEDYLEEYFKGKNHKKAKMYPNNACGDPKVIKINKELVFVFIDSQWWLQKWSEEKKMNHGCEIKSKGDFLHRMEEIFVDHKNREIVVLMHHPIKSNGQHGGKFSWKHHLFPIHELNNLYIPLPIIGSAYPIFRQTTGSVQDITNAHNQELMQGIRSLATSLRINVLFASGHEHCLEYFDDDKLKYIVSGSAAKQTYTRKGGDAEYARDARGFAKVMFYEDFEAWVEFYTVAGMGTEAVLEYKAQVRAPRAGTVEEKIDYPPIGEASTTLPANGDFAAGTLKKALLGTQYRDMWSTPVNVPIIDLETQNGGLEPIKKGGGMASNSLRMQQEDGKQYILRSINKDYTKLVPPQFSNLKLLNVMKDQNSASHPYGALIIPSLSKSAGVYYTHPKLVYLQHQKGLGNYNSQFPEELYLLEERPSGNWSDAEQFGNSDEIIGYVDLLDILVNKKNHFVDQEWVLKSRMFDLLIHDWDRHDDQWRWATFKEDDKTIYRPIPRDRDQAFYKFTGVIPWYVSSFMMKQFKTMKDDVKDVKHLAFNARNFDRYFLNDLEWEEWEQVIKNLQQELTDDEIRTASDALPSEVKNLNDDEDITNKLISRKAKLINIGKKLYDYLAKEVEISATDHDDKFEVVRKENGNVELKMWVKRHDKKDLLKFHRTFYPNETKEIRLYGLRGKDKCTISGANNHKIKIRFIGGEDDDKITNETQTSGIYVYDDIKGVKLKGDKMIDLRSADIEANEYDRTSFLYNTNLPSLIFGSSFDDGFWFGGGYSWTTRGWRKDPYEAKQKISFSFAPQGDEAFDLQYDGHFPATLGKLDFKPSLSFSSPTFENFFGYGNDSTNPLRETEYHWVRMQTYEIAPHFQLFSGNRRSNIQFGPLLQSVNIKNTADRITSDNTQVFNEDAFDRRNFVGAELNIFSAVKDNNVFPTHGFETSANLRHLKTLGKDENLTTLGADLKFYLTLINKPMLVFANDVGFETNFGDLQFYQYSDLGNSNHLRGFRNERFRGKSAFYHNMDLRLHLIKWSNNFIPMDIGVLAGYDQAKVWIDGEDSDDFHNSTSLGIWFDLLEVIVIQPYYTFTQEQDVFSLKMGFNF